MASARASTRRQRGRDDLRDGGSDRLAPYRARRDFVRTPEPAGRQAEAGHEGEPRFVVQRHRARRLHYDLRFEIDGVLVSFAVPRGPTLDPSVKRAAVHVEDHPIEYLDFEGVIPEGQYGAGDVIVWDTGTWRPHHTDDPAGAVDAGELHADVFGQKLRGRLVLVRRARGERGKEDWLLLHKHDEHAVDGWDPEAHPTSVLSGRTNEQVAADPDRMWRSDLPVSQASVPLRPRQDSGTPWGAADPVGALRDEELDALDGLDAGGTWEVFGRRLRLTNLDKVLFPAREGEEPVTKREFVAYAARVAPVALPYLAGRALNMHRFPNGVGTTGFWHKQLPEHAPDWVTRWHDPAAGHDKTDTYLVVDEPATLVWAANFGALEWHAWTSRTDAPERPTYALVDIDPGASTSWDDLLALARLHRTALRHLGVTGVAKLTGRRGIQIWIPIAPGPDFRETREWVRKLSKAVGAVAPDIVSWKWEVSRRGGNARLDYTQNAINKTLVAPYSPRPAAGAPVSAPIDWDELDDPELRPDGFTIRTMPTRLTTLGDLCTPLLTTDNTLPLIR